jgi:hypothetical protein
MKNRIFIRLVLSFLLLLSLFFPLIVQAEDEVQSSQYLNKVVLCRDVKESEPVFETTSFRSWDEKAVAWIRFTYQSQEPFMITWEWVDPEGKIYHVGEIEMDSGEYKNYRTWYWISIWDHHAANILGDWKVRILVDENLLTIEEFSIE